MRTYKQVLRLVLIPAVALVSLLPAVGSAQENKGQGPKVITKADALRSQRRGGEVGAQADGCGGTAAFWFDAAAGEADDSVEAYTNWAFCKINGSETNFFVATQGSAYSLTGPLVRFEPWLIAGSSGARLRDRDPLGQQIVYDENVTWTFDLAKDGGTAEVSFSPKESEYNPKIRSDGTLYSVQWAGYEWRHVTVPNKHVARWSGAAPWGMTVSNCGWIADGQRTVSQWGNCTHRDNSYY